MASPLGFIVAIGRLNWYRRVGEPREWFERIFVDFGQPGSQNHMETLTLTDIVTRDEITHKPVFCEPQLDLIKDYLPKFDYLFVTGAPPEDVDITDAADRLHNISVTKHFSRILIEYLKKNNINIPIHWYIAPEANLDSFISVEPQDNWKKYISQFISVMTDLSAENDLNAPEFLWSPYFTKYPSALKRKVVIHWLHDLLVSVPQLHWLHVQDGVGARSRKHLDGTMKYSLTADSVINYYNNVLRPAVKHTNVKSNLINMEFFIFIDNPQDPPNPFIIPGDPIEQQQRQTKYLQENVPLGISFEIAYWYGSLYYRAVPHVEGMNVTSAKQVINQAGLIPNVIGPTTNARVTKQDPPATGWDDISPWAPNGTTVNLTTDTHIIVPIVYKMKYKDAKFAIKKAGLKPVFHDGGIKSVVDEQIPEGGEKVKIGSKVDLYMKPK